MPKYFACPFEAEICGEEKISVDIWNNSFTVNGSDPY
jgi:hypothetical protein